MKNEPFIKLYPVQPYTDSKLAVVVENSDRDSLILNIQGWRRIMPNKTTMHIDNRQGLSYQCTPLDQHCCIQVRMTIKLGGKFIQHSVMSHPIRLAKQLRQRMLYVIQPVGCRIAVDQFSSFVSIQVSHKKIRFLGEFSKCQISLLQNSVDVDPNQLCFRLNVQHMRNEFTKFFSECLRWAPKIRSSFCFCIFNTKIERDLILALVSDNIYVTNHQPLKLTSNNMTPRNDKSLKNNGSASSLTSNNKSRNKQKEKVKITERLNLKRSYTKLSSNKFTKQPNNHECLNIFEDDDFAENHNTTKNKNDHSLNTPDTAMDLRGSFQEFEQKSFSKVQEDKISNHSFRQVNISKTENTLEIQNKNLKEENARLKKEIEGMNQSVREAITMKKKYMTAVEEINRLQNERRAIITDKVKFESSYHREIQQKEYLKKEIQSLKQIINGKGGKQ